MTTKRKSATKPLSGKEAGEKLGDYLKRMNLVPSRCQFTQTGKDSFAISTRKGRHVASVNYNPRTGYQTTVEGKDTYVHIEAVNTARHIERCVMSAGL
jgi:hypothetical protein